MKRLRLIRRTILFSLTGFIVLAAGISPAIVTRMQVTSNSMSPTINTGDHVFVDTLNARLPFVFPALHGIKRGDLIVFVDPHGAHGSESSRDFVVKRVVGLPGDRLHIAEGMLIVNGKPIYEPYLKAKDNVSMSFSSWPLSAGTTPRDVLIPPDSVFVLGDNRDVSLDSRIYGPLASENIVGKVIWLSS